METNRTVRHKPSEITPHSVARELRILGKQCLVFSLVELHTPVDKYVETQSKRITLSLLKKDMYMFMFVIFEIHFLKNHNGYSLENAADCYRVFGTLCLWWDGEGLGSSFAQHLSLNSFHIGTIKS